jgi:hypothetical protein
MFTLDQAKAAIVNKPEFSLKDKGSYSVIDYNLNSRDTFLGSTLEETRILLNLRGTAFDNTTGKIIRLAYEKFFNLGEFPESDARLNFNDDHLITQKLDGSLIAPMYTKEGTCLGTRAGVTDVSAMATFFKLGSDIDYDGFIETCQKVFHATPIFEFCSRQNRVVIDYPEDMLVLTGIRYINNGRMMSYLLMLSCAKDFNIPVVKKLVSINQSSLDEFKQQIADLKGEEGVVIRFNISGHTVKLKGSEYVLQHRAVDSLKFAKDTIALQLLGALDDIYPILPVTRLEHVQKFIGNFMECYRAIDSDIQAEYNSYSHLIDQKDFALGIANHKYKQFFFGIRKGTTVQTMLNKFCTTMCGTQAKCDELQAFLGMTYRY